MPVVRKPLPYSPLPMQGPPPDFGPIRAERNLYAWTSKHGYPCAIIRNAGSWHLNGYIGVPVSHPASRRDYEELQLSVHGGITYVEPADDNDFWWLGFDCAHGGDWTLYDPTGTYRTVTYVRKELVNLARQLKAMEGDPNHAY